ncbi:hypothetical protein A3849_20560 [Paenibacillus sp. P46E]|nr:hypothetical protein A3849_20560 [Paenibacillus sp. P46E]
MFISPMLLQTAVCPFSNGNYIFEPKIDGHRLIYSQQAGNVRLYTATVTMHSAVPRTTDSLSDDVILDGWVAA